MRGNLYLPKRKDFVSGISVLLAFSFFIAGCHTGSEVIPATPISVKKAEADSKPLPENAKSKLQNHKPETSEKNGASGILLPESGKRADSGASVSDLYAATDSYAATDTDKKNAAEKENATSPSPIALRDPFAMPARLKAIRSGDRQSAATQPALADPSSVSSASNSSFHNAASRHNTSDKNATQNIAAAPNSPEPYITGILNNGKETFIILHWNRIQGIFRAGEALGNGYYVREISEKEVLLDTDAANGGMKKVAINGSILKR